MGAIECEETALLLGYSDKEAADRWWCLRRRAKSVLVAAAIVVTISVPLSGICLRFNCPNGPRFQTTAGNWNVRFDVGHSPGHMSLFDYTRHLYWC